MIAIDIYQANVEDIDEPFAAFISIASQTETVPNGRYRERWNPEAVRKFTDEWNRAEQFAKAQLESECQELIEWCVAHPY